MYPVLFRLGSLEIHTYGVLVAAAFLAGLWLAQVRARRVGIPAERIGDLGVWILLAAIAGAKLFHIVFFWDEFISSWQASGWGSLRAGFVFYGGFIGAAVALLVFGRKVGVPFAKLADVLAPGLALGHALGRLGCFFEGCCYGSACRLPWAVRYPAGHMINYPVHPAQLYEAAGNLMIFGGLLWLSRRRLADGFLTATYLLAYAVLRFGIEFFRGEEQARYLGVFTIAQVTAIVLAVVAIVWGKRCRSSR